MRHPVAGALAAWQLRWSTTASGSSPPAADDAEPDQESEL